MTGLIGIGLVIVGASIALKVADRPTPMAPDPARQGFGDESGACAGTDKQARRRFRYLACDVLGSGGRI